MPVSRPGRRRSKLPLVSNHQASNTSTSKGGDRASDQSAQREAGDIARASRGDLGQDANCRT